MAQREQSIPSAYTGLYAMRSIVNPSHSGDVKFLWRTDPLAEAVVDDFARVPEQQWRAMLEMALASGIEAVPLAPESMRRLFAQLERTPEWIDAERCNFGGATFLRCRLGFAALAL